MYLYIIRHAQSTNNAGAAGDPNFKHVEDAPLSHLGHQQAAHLARMLRRHTESEDMQAALAQAPHLPIYRIDMLFSSPFKRALETSKPLADALDMPVHVMMDIYEYGGIYRREETEVLTFPGLNRLQMTEIVKNCVIPDDVTDKGWWTQDTAESEEQFVERGYKVAELIKQKAKGEWRGKHIAFVSHADFTNLLVRTLLRGEAERDPHRNSFMIPYNASVTRFDFGASGFPYLRYFSRVDHLPPEMATY